VLLPPLPLLRLDARDHLLLLTMHHIVSDAWSVGVLFEELGALYTAFSSGQSSPLPPLPIQYADFAHWQRQWLRGAVLDQQLAYWQQQLAGPLPVLTLPTVIIPVPPRKPSAALRSSSHSRARSPTPSPPSAVTNTAHSS